MKKQKVEYIVPVHGRKKLNIAKKLKNMKSGIKFYFKYHTIARFFAILFVLLCIIYAGKSIMLHIRYGKLTGGMEVQGMEEYAKTLKDVPSDIDGMSQYDKYAMGLDYRTGSDTDHDGLTDKEEIEIYGTDPLKASTSGDLYTDGYKASNNMDFDRQYEYTNNIEFSNNGCSEVNLTALSATDFDAVIEDCTNRYSLENWGISKVYKGYFIYNFSGKMTIDLTDTLTANEIDLNEVDIWLSKGAFLVDGLSKLDKCKYTADGNQITIKNSLDSDNYYYLFVTGKKTLFNSLFGKKNSDKLGITTNHQTSYKVLQTLTFGNITVYYPEQETAEATERILLDLQSRFSSETAFKKASEMEIMLKYKAYNTVIPFMNAEKLEKRWNDAESEKSFVKTTLIALSGWGFTYAYDDVNSVLFNSAAGTTNSEEFQKTNYNNYHTDFDPYEDELPFQNFGSQYSKNGNCAGISFLTAYLYNQGFFPATGSYNGIEWDLTTDEANATLTDAGLSDFKDQFFIDDKSGWDNFYIEDGLTAGEREFVKMIGACWKESNDVLRISEFLINNVNGLSWSNAESMMNRLDEGKIITTGFYLKNGTGHMVNIYDYYYINENEVLFRVYDNNIPQNHIDKFDLNCDGACYLQCKKVLNADGTYNMLYIYYPIYGATEYFASSDPDMMAQSGLLVSDETLTIYNR